MTANFGPDFKYPPTDAGGYRPVCICLMTLNLDCLLCCCFYVLMLLGFIFVVLLCCFLILLFCTVVTAFCFYSN